MTINTAERLRGAYGHNLDRFFNISLKNYYVYVQTPKVASTTLKARLNTLEAEGTKIDTSDLPLHPNVSQSIHVKPFQITNEMFSEIMGSSNFFKFCFVRNPQVRLLSCYLDKIKRKKREATGIYKALNLSLEGDELTFDQFVSFLWDRRTNSSLWNPHWRPLYSILRPDLISYNLIGKLETFDVDFARLNKQLHGRLKNDLTRTPHKTGSSIKIDDYYTPALRNKVHEIYARDFEHFGY